MNESLLTIIISGAISAAITIITALVNKKRTDADVLHITEQAQTEDVNQRKKEQDIAIVWEDRYGELVKRYDETINRLETTQKSTASEIENLERKADNERDARLAAEKRANRQATLLTELQGQIHELTELVQGLSEENEKLYKTIESQQITNEEQLSIISDLKKALIERDAKIVSLEKKNATLSAEIAIIRKDCNGGDITAM